MERWGRGECKNKSPCRTHGIIIIDANHCQADSTVTLTEPDKISLAFEMIKPYCPDKPDGEIKVIASGGVPGNGYTYMWSNYSNSSTISNIPAGTYFVTVTDANECSVKENVHLKPENEMCLIIHEAISPNGDLVNDLWNIGNADLYPEIEVTIYNRWGQSVWKSDKGYHHPWDGKSNGTPLPIDSYHYAIDLHNGSKIIVGDVTIVR